ncbi:MAG TPA: redoxin family protein, partial [Caulobacter sp.]|nr:redoxin family protein [Caulobacter sp.]
MSEIQSDESGAGKNGTGAKRSPLKWAIGAVMLVGVAAVLYVIAAASFKPSGPANLNEFKRASLAKLEVPASPRAAPGTTFFDEAGKPVTLADFKGQVVVMNLWATWCAPCKKEMPTLAKLAAAYAA